METVKISDAVASSLILGLITLH